MSRPHSPLYWRTHLAILAGAALVFFLAYLEATAHGAGLGGSSTLTDEINEAPAWIAHALWPIMQLGTVWAPIVIGVVVAAVYGPRRGAAVVISGLSAWFLAKFVKHLVERGRPLAYLPNINVREGRVRAWLRVRPHCGRLRRCHGASPDPPAKRPSRRLRAGDHGRPGPDRVRRPPRRRRDRRRRARHHVRLRRRPPVWSRPVRVAGARA